MKMQSLYESLEAMPVDKSTGLDRLFARINDLAKLKYNDPAAWEQLRKVYKARRVPRLAELDKVIDKRIAEVVAAKEAAAIAAKEEKDGFARSQKGLILNNYHNAMLAIKKLGVTLRYDYFNGMPVVEGLGELYGPMLDDHGMNRMWVAVEEKFGFRPAIGNFQTWVTDAAYQNRFHPVLDYLDSLEWDGVPRIDSWLTTYCGAADTAYTRAVGAIWLTAAVRRVRKPGTKFDEMMILEGEQGLNKSTALAKLAVKPEWFSDSVRLDVSEKEMIESTSGIWICEYGELQGMRKGDVAKIKAQLSRSTDRARLAYGRLPVRQPRQSIGAGTTNNGKTSEYLMDSTGNRRFWPIEVTFCDVEALERDRDQLWAEASLREASGASIRLPEELWPAAAAEQQERTVDNPFVEVLAEAFGKHEGWVRSTDVWDVLGISVAQRKTHGSAFGEALAALGWHKRNWRIEGQQTTVYAKGVQDSNGTELRLITDDYTYKVKIVPVDDDL